MIFNPPSMNEAYVPRFLCQFDKNWKKSQYNKTKLKHWDYKIILGILMLPHTVLRMNCVCGNHSGNDSSVRGVIPDSMTHVFLQSVEYHKVIYQDQSISLVCFLLSSVYLTASVWLELSAESVERCMVFIFGRKALNEWFKSFTSENL